MTTSRRIVFVVFPDFQHLDLSGPHEVFSEANTVVVGDGARAETESAPYVIDVVTARPGQVPASSGLVTLVETALDESGASIDTLVVVGGSGVRAAVNDESLVTWIRSTSAQTRRTVSVCSGAFLLAEAGVLAGRRATTHWDSCELLARQYPEVTVDPDPVFVRDGQIWTSAGVTAGIDLALALVESDCGAEVARAVARQLVVFVQRPGGQAQFSTSLAAQRPRRPVFRDLHGWIADHLADDLGVEALAGRAAMSPRHFARVFHTEFATTPGAYVAQLRLESARRLLESTDCGLDEIARRSGYGSLERLHRVFRESMHVTPGEYRARFTFHTV